MNDGLGAGFWFKLIGLVLLFGIGGILLFVFVGAAWARWGGLGALVFFFIFFLAFGYIYDRRHAKAYEDLEA